MVPSQAVRDTAKQIVSMLAAGDYARLVELSRGRRLTAQHMEEAIQEYGRTLRMPPDDQLKLDAILVTGSIPPMWHIETDLWTLEEGRSDLTLSMWLTEPAGGAVDVQLLDIHVL